MSSPVNLLLLGNSVLGINRSLGITKEMSAETRFKAVISNHCMSLTKKRIILSCFRKWKSRERIKSASIENYEQESCANIDAPVCTGLKRSVLTVLHREL